MLESLQSITFEKAFTYLKDPFLFIVVISLYCIFIFNFYKHLAKKDLFHINLQQKQKSQKKFVNFIAQLYYFILKYFLILPLLTVIWFAIFALFFIFLSKNQNVETILIIAVSVVSVIRFSAHYNEELSIDVAKLIPLSMLSVFLIDFDYFELSRSLNILYQLPQKLDVVLYFIFLIFFIEVLLRMIGKIRKRFKKEKSE